MSASSKPLSRGPTLGWESFHAAGIPGIASIEDLPHKAITTSGRAAIYQALLQLKLPPASSVLVPSYHCPTIIAPVIFAGLKVAYFGIQADGLPKLDTIAEETASKCKAMIVSHYFGLARSLTQVRQWCDDRGIALIEDCAHSYFGLAGDRPVGTWGDYSTASLTKFFPVPEGGLLASTNHPIANLELARQGFKAQLKSWINILELATIHRRLTGLNSTLAFMFWFKNWHQRSNLDNKKNSVFSTENSREVSETVLMRDCDMVRISLAPLWATRILNALLPRGQIVARRQRNFACYAKHLVAVQGAAPLFTLSKAQMTQNAPYVFPLWVDDADRIYHALRAQNLPVFRWDRIWPGTPQLAGDVGPLWSHHVLQLLCHQDLSEPDIERISNSLMNLLPNQH